MYACIRGEYKKRAYNQYSQAHHSVESEKIAFPVHMRLFFIEYAAFYYKLFARHAAYIYFRRAYARHPAFKVDDVSPLILKIDAKVIQNPNSAFQFGIIPHKLLELCFIYYPIFHHIDRRCL